MKSYLLEKIDPVLWSRAKAIAAIERITMRDMLIAMLERRVKLTKIHGYLVDDKTSEKGEGK